LRPLRLRVHLRTSDSRTLEHATTSACRAASAAITSAASRASADAHFALAAGAFAERHAGLPDLPLPSPGFGPRFESVPVLSLTPEEARELKLALDVRLHSLRVELTFTDIREYRAFLRNRLDRLEAIAARLDAEEARSGPPAAP
jgi:hypothetical protein